MSNIEGYAPFRDYRTWYRVTGDLKDAAKALCERLLAYAGPLLLYAEELEAASGRHLGNYPQAFTHLALINAVSHVIADDS